MTDQPSSRRTFVLQAGAAATVLAAGVTARGQGSGPAAPAPAAPAAPAASPVPGKEKLIVRSPRPLNLETPLEHLGADVTPTELFFVRNNYDGPVVDPARYTLVVDGEVEKPLSLSLEDLRKLPQVTQVVTLECAGNGRSFHKPPAPGLQWEHGAVGTAIWSGVPLAEVLALARPRPTALHVVPNGNDGPPTPQAPDFVRSHPLWKARDPHTLLALTMNGQPVPHLHGGPVRLLVPGWVGSASIKWVNHITLAEQEWSGPFMQRSYRSPRVDDQQHTYSLQSLEVKSVIVSPAEGARVPAGPLRVTGFAWGGEGTIVAVDVSADGGQTWKPASLAGPENRYGWRRWEASVDAAAGGHTLMARATDSLGRFQPAGRPRDPQGYRWNVIHAVRVTVA